MKNNKKVRYFVGYEVERYVYENATPDRTFSTFDEAKNKMAEFQTVDRNQPYFATDLTKLHVIERTIETTFVKYLVPKS